MFKPMQKAMMTIQKENGRLFRSESEQKPTTYEHETIVPT